VFTVTINGTSDRPVTVDFTTVDGTATSSGLTPDFLAQIGTLTFTADDTAPENHFDSDQRDIYKEANENFQVKLSNATNATIARDTGTGTDSAGRGHKGHLNDQRRQGHRRRLKGRRLRRLPSSCPLPRT
jgi:hypothetical protein